MTMNVLQDLSLQLGMGRRDLLYIISTAPRRYKVYDIPKRHGGVRTIAQPSREVKAIQRVLLERVLSKFPVHAAAMAYVEGRNIAMNADAHAGTRVILKMDFSAFFPSLVVEDWLRLVKKRGPELDDYDLWVCTHALFWGRRSSTPICLSIGAPTSPMLSNILMYDLDTELAQAAGDIGVAYTRYADDITVSGETIEAVKEFEVRARSIIRRTKSPRLIFNEEKRGVYTSGQKRMVTGLVLTSDGEVSLGRERKRLISAMLHRASFEELGSKGKATLKGLLAFAISAEPEFVSRMRKKYSDELVERVLRYHIERVGPPPRKARR